MARLNDPRVLSFSKEHSEYIYSSATVEQLKELVISQSNCKRREKGGSSADELVQDGEVVLGEEIGERPEFYQRMNLSSFSVRSDEHSVQF